MKKIDFKRKRKSVFILVKDNVTLQSISDRCSYKSIDEALWRVMNKWIGRRILLAMNLNKEVQKALEERKITNSVAEVIGTLDSGSQTQFLEYLLKIILLQERRHIKLRNIS